MRAAAVVNDALLTLSQQEGFSGGTTAVFALVSQSQVLLGHLGDSKAISCHLPTAHISPYAHKRWQPTNAHGDAAFQGKLQSATLTHNHSPDRPDELARITAAGGFMSKASAGEPTASCHLSTMHVCQSFQ